MQDARFWFGALEGALCGVSELCNAVLGLLEEIAIPNL